MLIEIAFAIIVLSFILSYVGIACLSTRFKGRQILDMPNERSSHSVPTPRGGGVVVVVFSILGIAICAWLGKSASFATPLACVASLGLVSGIGLWDDIHPLPNRVRFTVHIIAAIIIIVGFSYWKDMALPIVGHVYLGVLGIIISFLWIVGLTNAYNFMDGIDGIAGSQAVIAGAGWGLFGWHTNQWFVMVIGLLLMSTSAGFLLHNWPPAKIFMGDVGSTFLGCCFALLPIAASRVDSRLAIVGIVLVWPFVFDTGYTMLRRLRHHENIFTAHRSHLYQRLVIAGWSHRSVTLLYILLNIISLLAAMAWMYGIPGSGIALVLVFPVSALVLLFLVFLKEQRSACFSENGKPNALGNR